jgi:pimeloyl-ACP methyl ester carboxylesterase
MRKKQFQELTGRTLGLVLACGVGFSCTSDDASDALMDASQPALPGASDGGAGAGDAGVADAAPSAFEPPVADDCITDVSPGDHTFTCQGLTFLVMVDEMCTQRACGLIFDVHGGTMSGLQMRDNTKLHELAPKAGYLVVHPSATSSNTGGSWNFDVDPPKLADFMTRMIKAFHVDEERVHVTGFSMGSGMTFWFLCNHRAVLASTAPVSGASADMILDLESGTKCLDTIDASWAPRVPILFMNGLEDRALTIDLARQRVEGLVSRLELVGGEEIDGDGHFTRKRWTGADDMVLEYIEHDYGGQAALGGHCIPGGTDLMGGPNNFGLNATTCSTGDIKLHWGETVLQWFIDHPKQR